MMKDVITIASCCLLSLTGKAQSKADAITGKWMHDAKDLIVEVYRENNDFRAKIIWFHDDRDTITPIDQWLDERNPDKQLRDRKILGMDVLYNLEYNAGENKWINGKIYDASSGKTWDAAVSLRDPQTMEVRGYYIFKFIGKTIKFTRM